MKKILKLSGLLALLALFLISTGASAQTELLFGQKHFYSVFFRGNGESITYARIVITNNQETPMTEFNFEIPKVTPTEMVVIQQLLPQRCIKWNYDYKNPQDPYAPKTCLELGDADYSSPSYNSGYYYNEQPLENGTYQKVKYTKTSTGYNLSLAAPIAPNKSSAIIIAYAAKGYVTNIFGLQKINFETIKVNSRIETIKVAIDVDSDLLLKGKGSSVNYNEEPSMMAQAPSNFAGLSSSQLDSKVSRIGSYGPLMKETKNLANNESFVVKGEYATNWFRLYLSNILWAIGIVVVIFFLLSLLKKRLKKNNKTTTPNTTNNNKGSNLTLLDPLYASMSFLSAMAVLVLSYLMQFVSDSSLFGSLGNNPVFLIIGFITVILLYFLAVFGLSIITSIQHGWKAFISIILGEFLWYLIFLIFFLILFSSGLNFPSRMMY